MKKLLKYFVLALVLILPFSVNAASNVRITDVSLEDVEGEVEGFDNPTYEGMSINLNGTFKKLYSSVAYKITMENKDNIDYGFADFKECKDTVCPPVESIEYAEENGNFNYNLSCEDNYVLKANSTKSCYLWINYHTSVNDLSGNYVKNYNFTIHLDDDANNAAIKAANANKTKTKAKTKIEKNPATTAKTFIIGLLILGIVIATAIITKGKAKNKLLSVLVLTLLLPITVYAITKVEVKVNTNIGVDSAKTFCYVNENYTGEIQYQEYENGMSWYDFLQGNNMTQFGIEYGMDGRSDGFDSAMYKITGFVSREDIACYMSNLGNCEGEFNHITDLSDDIIDSSQVCYEFSD